MRIADAVTIGVFSMSVVAVLGLGYVGLPRVVEFGKLGRMFIVDELKRDSGRVSVHEPVTDAGQAAQGYGVQLVEWDDLPRADAIIGAMAHRGYLQPGVYDFTRKLVRALLHWRKGDIRCDSPVCLGLAGPRVWRL